MIDLTALQVDELPSYLIALLVPLFDAVLPILPSETAVIALGVATAGSIDPRIAILVILAAVGAFLGDNLSYVLGRRFGPTVNRRFFAGPKGIRRRLWAENALETYGTRLIVICRFIPGGRTAVTLTCGLIGYSRHRFIVATAASGAIWASYAFLVGRIGGKAFESRPWMGLVLALGSALLITVLIEIVRRMLSRRRTRRSGSSEESADTPEEIEGPILQ